MQPESQLDRVSNRVQAMKISPTIAMSERASAMKAEGRDVISLSLGELDFNTPESIIEAAHLAALKGLTRYTAPDGMVSLKRAVRAKMERDSALSFELNEIHVASGCKQVIYNALAATLDKSDEVVIFAPYWVSYSDLIEFCGGTVVVVHTSAGDGFLPDPAKLAEVLTPRTKWVLLNSPNNPTGAIYGRERLRQLAEILAAYPAVLVMADEIYEQLTFDSNIHVPFLQAAPHMRDRVVTVNGVSKTYAMTGWRIGFGAGPSWVIAAMAKVQSQTAGNSCSVAQAAAQEALSGDQSLVASWRTILETRRDHAIGILKLSRWLEVPQPLGAFYLFCGVSRCIGARTPSGAILKSDIDVADYLLSHAGIATVAGEAFGASPFLRLSFALDIKSLTDACGRIVEACDKLVR